ncbi:MAG: serine protease [Desulfobulbaceae bacterium]|nr:serine protease [Desulfobulbaceae bacterium]
MKRSFLLILLIFVTSCIFFQNLGQGNDDVIVDSNLSEMDPRQVLIDPLSARPLYLIQIKGNEPLGTATGFIVEKENKHYLITNWHVVSGLSPQSGEALHPEGKTPDALLIWHHGKQLGTWKRKREMLVDDKGNKRWLEHKKGKLIDIAALPLEAVTDDIQIYSLDLSLAEVNMVPGVAMPVSIIGFPVGLTSAGFFPIWKTGHIASEPNLDYQNEPLFLIDATTRGGMSGSPVVLRMSGGYKTSDGNMIMGSSYRTRFLGIYSGRLPRDSEIGRVWRPKLINEILK